MSDFMTSTTLAPQKGLPEIQGTAGITVSNGTTNPNASLSTTGVSAGSFVNSNLTVDTQGRISLAATGVGGSLPSDFVKVASGSVSSVASFVLTGFSTAYPTYLLFLSNMYVSTSGDTLFIRTSADGGSTFNSGATDYITQPITARSNLSNPIGGGAVTTSAITMTTSVSNVATSAVSAMYYIHGPADSAKRTRFMSRVWHLNSTALSTMMLNSDERTATEINNAISIYPTSGTITALNYVLYGLKA